MIKPEFPPAETISEATGKLCELPETPKINHLVCSIDFLQKCGEGFSIENVLKKAYVPYSKKQICYVCHEKFKNGDIGAIGILSSEMGKGHIVCHLSCYKLMTMR